MEQRRWEIGRGAPDDGLSTVEFFRALGTLLHNETSCDKLGEHLLTTYGAATVAMLKGLTTVDIRDSLREFDMKPAYEDSIAIFLTASDAPAHEFKKPKKLQGSGGLSPKTGQLLPANVVRLALQHQACGFGLGLLQSVALLKPAMKSWRVSS